MSPTFIEALLDGRREEASDTIGATIPDGWPDDHDANFLHMRLGQMRDDPSTQEWLARAMVHRETSKMIGHIGFHGPPQEGWAELGYTVFEQHRRRGYAEESVRSMMRWARDSHGVQTFRLSIAPDNGPSLALAAKLGFKQIGEQMDPEDGLEYVFELKVG
jgi:RimJ/RimL family protein N-acetyltransferase